MLMRSVIWKSLVEAERVLKIDYHMEPVVGHLRELEKAPVKMFVYYNLKASHSTILRLYTTRKCIVAKKNMTSKMRLKLFNLLG